MDNKKLVKDFISYICDWVEYSLRVNGHDGLYYNVTNDKMAYLIVDKAIEIRIKNMLLKKFGLKSEVFYEFKELPNLHFDGELRVKLLIVEKAK